MSGGSRVFGPSTQARGVRCGGGIEVNDLPRGVNAGVGAAGANGGDRLAGDEAERRLAPHPAAMRECACDCQPA